MAEQLQTAETHDDVARMLVQFLAHADGLPILATKDALGRVKRYDEVGLSHYDECSELVVEPAYEDGSDEDAETARIRRLMGLEIAALFLDEQTFLHFDTPINAIRPNDDMMILRDSSPEFGVKHSVLLAVDRAPIQS